MGNGVAKPVSLTKLREEFVAGLQRAKTIEDAVTRRPDRQKDPVREGTTEWTNAVLNLVLEVGRAHGYSVWPTRLYFSRPRGRAVNAKYYQPEDRGEYLVDACWTQYPDEDLWLERLQSGNKVATPRMALACECEWCTGRWGQHEEPRQHALNMLRDFSKLTDLAAPLKLFIFGFQQGVPTADFDDLVKLCKRAASPISEAESYLLLSWPGDAKWSERTSRMRSEILTAP
jgi:hypothetical protein